LADVQRINLWVTESLLLAPFQSLTLLPGNSEKSVAVILIESSALMLLVRQQEGHPVCKKTEWQCAGVVICLEQGADLHMAQLMPLPLAVSCFI